MPSDNSGKDVLMEDGEPYPPRIKGTVKNFLEHEEDFNYDDDRGCIPVNVDRAIDFDLYYAWCQFVTGHLDGVDWDFVHNGEHSNTFESIVRDYIRANDDILERFKEISYWCQDGIILFNVKAADEQGGIQNLVDKYGKREVAELSYQGSQYVDKGEDDGSDSGEDIGQAAVEVFD